MNQITREQRVLGAAVANVLFVISLFFSWYGEGEFSASGDDVVPSWWVLLLCSIGAAGLLLSERFDVQLPAAIRPTALAAYLSSISLIVTVMVFLEGGAGRKFGIFLALLFAIVAFVLSFMHWREEE